MENNEKPDRILEKISALLEKTVEHGATQEEAIIAATLAQKLMAKYHIDKIELSQGNQENIDETQLEARRKWVRRLGVIVGQSLCCYVITSQNGRNTYLKFIGRDTDRNIATKTFLMLVSICRLGIKRAKAQAKMKFGETSGIEVSYAEGFLMAVNEEMGKQCHALMLVIPEEVNQAVHRKYPNLRTIKISSPIRYRHRESIEAAQKAGYNDGKNALIKKSLK